MPCTSIYIDSLQSGAIDVGELTVSGTLNYAGAGLVISGIAKETVSTTGVGLVGGAPLTSITTMLGAYTVAVTQSAGSNRRSVATFSIARADTTTASPTGEMVHRICSIAGDGGVLNIEWPAGSFPFLTQTDSAGAPYEVVITGAPF